MPIRYVAVCGATEATPSQLDAAREVGKLLARSGAILINGGYGGVSGAASEGAAREGGTVVGPLYEGHRDGAKQHPTHPLPHGLGQGPNLPNVNQPERPSATRWGQGN